MLNCCIKRFWKKHKKLTKLYSDAQERIESDLNIVRITTGLRNLNILMKNSLMDLKAEFNVAHVDEAIIKIDESFEESPHD